MDVAGGNLERPIVASGTDRGEPASAAGVRSQCDQTAGALERIKAVTAADWVWLNESKVSITPENSATKTHLLDSLTRREVEVLRLIAEGKSSKEVAKELGMAFRTAVCHRYRIFQKLKVHETASVVRLAVRAGLIHA
jgi:DNA-binding NarL/FixJ family response regulator